MKRLTILISTLLGIALAPLQAAELKTLGPGTYQATVKAIVCDGCGEFIQQTMLKQPGIGTVSVDQKAKKVRFQVKPQARIKVADLQQALKASAEQMGMGADYSLSEIQAASSSLK